MRFVSSLVFVSLMLATPLFAASPAAQALLDQASDDCKSFENGLFDAGDAVVPIELTSQYGTIGAEVVDTSKFACSSAASLFCGSGGCMLNLIVGDTTYAWQATGWRLIDWGPDRILLIGRDGGWCGGAGAEVCYEAVVWSDGRLLTVGEAPENR